MTGYELRLKIADVKKPCFQFLFEPGIETTISKMRFLTVVLFTVCLISFAKAYAYVEKVEERNGGCYHPDIGHIANGGVVYNDKECEQRKCTLGEAGPIISTYGCGVISIKDPNCKLLPGEGSYPSCCPAPVCKKPNQE
ncbi:uncharacterized protein LOC143242479 [Tachypleus tridentatus]|uniref:uncharacterized protein LOC143242479 n=1 Tax=Tachypleus tridentatus TaxID=6853 RepID=UPI003FD2D15C